MSERRRSLSPAIKQVSRQLRKQQTPVEWRLWLCLRKRQFRGLHFRRQHPIGHFIVDFYCAEHRLVVEIDGKYHNYQAEYDEARTDWLEAHGYHVLRFSNEDERNNLQGVLSAIFAFVENRENEV
ncbi:MAG TPA: DUF559 domain-containing protein [Aggregatilineales bacterium]|nr:DUF559 domain-containing protein [Aggregatilineales bacterium]HPV07386.1 DUF559 domain-containing protein [Aggregatilineales bacterium]HQA67917.1 DUF559 domain-containing protein [Aggregatilineales bacterium]HQE18250.1 DUF559 domain-containing protein [Aggregatilineales bacterium]